MTACTTELLSRGVPCHANNDININININIDNTNPFPPAQLIGNETLNTTTPPTIEIAPAATTYVFKPHPIMPASQSPNSSPTSIHLNEATIGQISIAGANGSSSSSSSSSTFDEVPQIPPYIRNCAMCFCIIIMILGVVGNVMVPIVIVKTKDMRNSTNIFLTNLSIADLLVLLVCTPTVLVEVNTRPETWILGHEMCKLVPFVELTVAHASVLTILAISFERYYAICEPLKAGYVCTKTRAILICFLAWAIAALFTSPILWVAEYKWVEYIDGSSVAVCLTQAITNWTIGFFLMTISVFFILPLFILIALYGIIAKNLISDSGPMMRIRPTKPELSLKARKQVVLMLGAVVLSFFLCLLPFRVLTMWIILSSEPTFLNIGIERYYNLLYFCRIMLYLNSAMNPILYNLMSTKFRKGFFKLICSCWNCTLNGLTLGRHFRKRSGVSRVIGTTTTTNNTISSSNAATTTSSSVLSRSSNRRRSSEEITRTKLQIQMQIPFGNENETMAMLHTNDFIPEEESQQPDRDEPYTNHPSPFKSPQPQQQPQQQLQQQQQQQQQPLNLKQKSTLKLIGKGRSHESNRIRTQISFDEKTFIEPTLR